MFSPHELDAGALKENRTERLPMEKDALNESAQSADLESAGLELTDEERRAVDEAAAMPLEDTAVETVEKSYATARCEGCVGSHTGTGVRVTIHNT